MAKKLHKLKPGELIKNFDRWKGQYLQFVMKDRVVRLLRPVSWESKKITTWDTKQQRIVLNLPSIEEIWRETEITNHP